MKKLLLTVAIVASFGVAGCASNNTWTAWDAGRTAGHGPSKQEVQAYVQPAKSMKADTAFSESLRK